MIKTLTDRFVATARPTGRFTEFCDTKARGLTLRVGARTKVWYFAHRSDGLARRRWLGRYPALTLAHARKRVTAERARLDQPTTAPVTLAPEVIEQLGQTIAALVVRALRQEREP